MATITEKVDENMKNISTIKGSVGVIEANDISRKEVLDLKFDKIKERIDTLNDDMLQNEKDIDDVNDKTDVNVANINTLASQVKDFFKFRNEKIKDRKKINILIFTVFLTFIIQLATPFAKKYFLKSEDRATITNSAQAVDNEILKDILKHVKSKSKTIPSED